MPSGEKHADPVKPRLGLWDTMSIIVGIVVGVSIFKAPPLIFANVATPWHGLLAWGLGGILALVGAFCYAELASTYPRAGGDYIYLSRAYGPAVGFFFAWAQIVAVLTGSICVMAYVFADYAVEFFSASAENAVGFAAAAVVVLTLLNCSGMVAGSTAQNILTIAKVLGLFGVVVSGIFWGGAPDPLEVRQPMSGPGFGLAMVLVLYTYGGWNDAAFVTAEIHDTHRNIPRALLLGIGVIFLLYLLINVAYLKSLGFEGLRNSATPAADVLKLSVGKGASQFISLLVMISALGAINGMILTGSRLYAAVGAEHRMFSLLGHWNERLGAPVWSCLVQAVMALLLLFAVGTEMGRSAIDGCFRAVAVAPPSWENFSGGFERLVAGIAPVFWFFFLLTGISLFVLRKKDRDIPRVYKVPAFPIPPLLFCGMCIYMLWSAVAYAGTMTLVWTIPLLAALPFFVIGNRHPTRNKTDEERGH